LTTVTNALKHTGPLLAALIVGGCAIGPNFKTPEAGAPPAYRDQAGAGDASFADLAWWDVYKDPQLTALIKTALTNGYDVRIAAARVEQSRAVAAEVHGQLFPGVGYEANADRGRNALLGGPYTQGGGSTANGYDGYLAAAWEFDLWGRVRRLDEAARSQYLASEEARRGVLLSLTSDVAAAYYELLELDEELQIVRNATQSFGESLKLFNLQLAGGVVSKLETTSAEAAMAASAARIPELEMLISLKENQISVLVGRNPGPVVRGAKLWDQAPPPDVPAGLPSALLERRPDIREAEESAEAANANIGVTLGGFLPRIGLSAILGAVSPSLDNITSRGAGLWSVGAQATGPLFQGGGLRGQYDQAKAAWDEAKLRYQQTALNAFGDVASALVTRQRMAEVREQQAVAVRAYEDAVRLANQRYRAGRASYYEVLQEQQLLFPEQVTLAQARRDEYIAIVQLYRSLGGGWNLSDSEWTAAARSQ
jgi:multidrug efflux system outer membrane protein